MKLLIILSLLFCACASRAAGQTADDFNLRVRLTSGEHSRDSSSQTTSLTIAPEGNKIVWGQTFTGRRRGTPAEQKEFKLSSADRAVLLKLIRAEDLLVTKSIDIPKDDSGYSYFAIAIDLALDGKKGSISITGPRTGAKVKEEKLYQDALALIREIYRIISAQDRSVHFEELVRE